MQEEKLLAYARTIEALQPLLELRSLAAAQVSLLASKLFSRTEEWKKQLYQPAYLGAPSVAQIDVGPNGTLRVSAALAGTNAPAMHISNASDLRATLLALLFAYWEYLLRERGGLALILLDDIHELFDEHNRVHVANTLPRLVEAGAQILLSTNSHTFRRHLHAAVDEQELTDNYEQLEIHTLSPNRDALRLGQLKEKIDGLRKTFLTDENNEQAAWDYLNEGRIYVEERLLDLIIEPLPGLPAKPSASDLFAFLRSLNSRGLDLYCLDCFKNICQNRAVSDGSELMGLLNASHHGIRSQITYVAVKKVDSSLQHVLTQIESAHLEFLLWMRRAQTPTARHKPSVPEVVPFPDKNLPLYQLAAFSSSGNVVLVDEDDVGSFALDSLQNIAFYKLSTDNLGFAAKRHDTVLVSCSHAEAGSDNCLAVVLDGSEILVGRIHRDPTHPQTITVSSDAEDPRDRTPGRCVWSAAVQVLPIVGVLFTRKVNPPVRIKGQAELVTRPDLLSKVEFIFEVRGESAVPMALEGQALFGGPQIQASELDRYVGAEVAISAGGGGYFKRVGRAMPDYPHLRFFEPIGPKGDSLILATEFTENEALSSLPVVTDIRLVLGVLYEPSF